MIDTILNYFLCAACGALVTWIGVGTKRLQSLTKVIKALSHDALFTRCEWLINKGSITKDDLENLDMLYDAYSGMGMNGAGEELYNRAKALPLETTTVGRQ